MKRTAYYKDRARHFGNRFLRILINTVMGLLLLAAVVFVLWLNFLATPRTAVNQRPAAESSEGDNPSTPSTASPPAASVKTESSGGPASAASEQGASQPATAPPAGGSSAPSAAQPMSAYAGAGGSAMSSSIAGIAVPRLIIPVAGIRTGNLRDTFTASRSEGRTHNALDIMAPQATPVLAAASGSIRRLMQSDRGGTTIYQLSDDGKLVYYYAHLERYADGLTEGKTVRQGEVIGYVGDTGNAGAGNYHLHFAVWMISDPKHFWQGENVNPYGLLCH